MFVRRGKMVVCMAPEGDELAGAAGGGFDFDSAGLDIAAGLGFETENGDADDIDLGDSALGDADPAAPAGGDPAAASAAQSATPPATGDAATQQGAAAPAVPRTWRPEAAAKWAALPPEVQQEVLKREEDMFKGIEAYKTDANFGKSLKGVLDPYMPVLRQYNIDPAQQIAGLMQTHHTLALGTPEQKTALFQKLAQQYGVQLGGEAPYVDPQVAALQQELRGLQSRLQGREQQEANVQREKLQSELNAFAADPAHPYFDEVANDIAAQLRAGAKDLAEAYERAVWANPVTRAKEQSRLTAEQTAKAQREAEERAAAARKATSANVKSKAKAASGTAPLGSIDDTLNAAFADIKSRT